MGTKQIFFVPYRVTEFVTIILVQLHGFLWIVRYILAECTGPRTQNLCLQIARSSVSPTTGAIKQPVRFVAIVFYPAFARHEHFGQIVAAGWVRHAAVDQLSIRGLVVLGTETYIAIEVGGFFVSAFKERQVFPCCIACNLINETKHHETEQKFKCSVSAGKRRTEYSRL
jgi:hypothetical protein